MENLCFRYTNQKLCLSIPYIERLHVSLDICLEASIYFYRNFHNTIKCLPSSLSFFPGVDASFPPLLAAVLGSFHQDLRKIKKEALTKTQHKSIACFSSVLSFTLLCEAARTFPFLERFESLLDLQVFEKRITFKTHYPIINILLPIHLERVFV